MEIKFSELRKFGVAKGYTKEARILAKKILRTIRDKKIVSRVTYGDLLPTLDFTYPPNRTLVGLALGLIWEYCEEEGLQPLNFLVVSKLTNYPGAGVLNWFKKKYGAKKAAYYEGYCDRVIDMVTYHLVNGLLIIEDEEE